MWISTFSSRSKSSPENETKLSLFRFAPAVESSTHIFSLMPIDPWKKLKKRINNAILISHSTIPAMVVDSSSTKLPRNARGNIIRRNSISSKNNLRGIRMAIGPIRGINSLTPLSSLANVYKVAQAIDPWLLCYLLKFTCANITSLLVTKKKERKEKRECYSIYLGACKFSRLWFIGNRQWVHSNF